MKAKEILQELQRWTFPVASGVLCIFGGVNLFIGTYFAAEGNISVAGTCLAAGLVLVLAGNIDKFESLKGLGIEAKTRKLEEKITEATDILARIRELSELTCESLVNLQSKAGRFTGPPTPQYAYATAQNVVKTLKGVGSSSSKIRTALSSWIDMFLGDFAAALYAPVKQKQRELMAALHQEMTYAQLEKNDEKADEVNRRIVTASKHNVRSNDIYEIVASNPEAFMQFVLEAPVSSDEAMAPVIAQIKS
ncbi:hypothetical protein [Dyella acidiphila]|uniref:Uncharacterized protein n=1 Tax=Dyella acidiphila TaxID=2775866 RepID=A0ABR9GFU7_9GAMM|nr:hypothetical protein [Dyella acidiphila]MBE1162898.1 hypothetical protein [Dyella acidiphila]